MPRGARFLLSLLLCLGWAGLARADDPPLPLLRSMSLLGDTPNYIDLAAGGYALYFSHHEFNQDAGADVTLRLGQKWNYIGPAAGVVTNTDGGVFVYAGGYADIQWGPIIFTPLIGAGVTAAAIRMTNGWAARSNSACSSRRVTNYPIIPGSACKSGIYRALTSIK